MKHIYLFVLLLFSSITLLAQDKTDNSAQRIIYQEIVIQNDKSGFEADFNIQMNDFDLVSNGMVLITPRLQSSDSKTQYHFPSLVISGNKRAKMLKRSESLSGRTYDFPVYIRKNKTEQSIPLKLSVPFEEWMKDAELIFEEEISGCAECLLAQNEHIVKLPLIEPYVPVYSLTYLMPEAEAVKERSKGYAAQFNYKVGKYDILPDYSNNAKVIREITDLIDEIKADKNLTVTGTTVTGYASPEGNAASNLRLSENRAKSFADFLTRRYAIPAKQLSVNWKGEDWAGFTQSIQNSSILRKEEILTIISNGKTEDERENELRRLNNGQVFQTLLADYFPPLRRNELNVNFVVKAFDLEEAKEIIRTNPHYLSLNEMYLVANTYSKGSAEFKEVFDIAYRIYPQDRTAQLNAATADIEAGLTERAISILKKLEFSDAWNNLGVAYAQEGEVEKATQLFEKAMNTGHSDAKKNYEELLKIK